MKIVVLTTMLCMAFAARASDVKEAAAEAVVAPVAATTPKADKLAKGEEEEMVCERKKKLGSNMVERVCMTVAQRDAEEQRAKDDISRIGRCSGNDSVCSGSL